MKIDYYDILKLSRDAKQKDIAAAYKQLAKQWHPSNNPGYEARAERRFRKISEAYQILSDVKRRSQYNKALMNAGKRAAMKKNGSVQLISEDDTSAEAEKSESQHVSSSGSDPKEVRRAGESVVLGSRYAHAHVRAKPDETPLGKNLLVQQVGGNSVTCFPETLLALRNPYQVYEEICAGAKPDSSRWAYCEQLVEWHLASMAKVTDLLDVFGNRIVVTTLDYADGKKSISVTRNGKPVRTVSVPVPLDSWLEEERQAKEGRGHVVIIEDEPEPPPGMQRLPREF